MCSLRLVHGNLFMSLCKCTWEMLDGALSTNYSTNPNSNPNTNRNHNSISEI